MADLPSGPTVKVNDIEVAANAPVSEALNRKYGVNVNGLIDGLASTVSSTSTNTSGVATNLGNISTNTSNITFLQARVPEFFNGGSASISTGVTQVIASYVGGGVLSACVVHFQHAGSGPPVTVLVNSGSAVSGLALGGAGTATVDISGNDLRVTAVGGLVSFTAQHNVGLKS